jgi:hypothetical protein
MVAVVGAMAHLVALVELGGVVLVPLVPGQQLTELPTVVAVAVALTMLLVRFLVLVVPASSSFVTRSNI